MEVVDDNGEDSSSGVLRGLGIRARPGVENPAVISADDAFLPAGAVFVPARLTDGMSVGGWRASNASVDSATQNAGSSNELSRADAILQHAVAAFLSLMVQYAGVVANDPPEAPGVVSEQVHVNYANVFDRQDPAKFVGYIVTLWCANTHSSMSFTEFIEAKLAAKHASVVGSIFKSGKRMAKRRRLGESAPAGTTGIGGLAVTLPSEQRPRATFEDLTELGVLHMAATYYQFATGKTRRPPQSCVDILSSSKATFPNGAPRPFHWYSVWSLTNALLFAERSGGSVVPPLRTTCVKPPPGVPMDSLTDRELELTRRPPRADDIGRVRDKFVYSVGAVQSKGWVDPRALDRFPLLKEFSLGLNRTELRADCAELSAEDAERVERELSDAVVGFGGELSAGAKLDVDKMRDEWLPRFRGSRKTASRAIRKYADLRKSSDGSQEAQQRVSDALEESRLAVEDFASTRRQFLSSFNLIMNPSNKSLAPSMVARLRCLNDILASNGGTATVLLPQAEFVNSCKAGLSPYAAGILSLMVGLRTDCEVHHSFVIIREMLFASWGVCDEPGMRVNRIHTGAHSVGKSHTMRVHADLLPKGTVNAFANISTLAFSGTGNKFDYSTVTMDDAPPSALGVQQGSGRGGRGVPAGRTGNTDKEAIIKTWLTGNGFKVATRIDNKPVIHETKMHNCFIALTNATAGEIPTSMRSRVLCHEAETLTDETIRGIIESKTMRGTSSSANSGDGRTRTFTRLMDVLVNVTLLMMQAGDITPPSLEAVAVVCDRALDKAVSVGVRDGLSIRNRERVNALARVHAIFRAILIVFMLPGGVHYGKPWTGFGMLHALESHLVVTEEMAACVLGGLWSQYVDPVESAILKYIKTAYKQQFTGVNASTPYVSIQVTTPWGGFGGGGGGHLTQNEVIDGLVAAVTSPEGEGGKPRVDPESAAAVFKRLLKTKTGNSSAAASSPAGASSAGIPAMVDQPVMRVVPGPDSSALVGFHKSLFDDDDSASGPDKLYQQNAVRALGYSAASKRKVILGCLMSPHIPIPVGVMIEPNPDDHATMTKPRTLADEAKLFCEGGGGGDGHEAAASAMDVDTGSSGSSSSSSLLAAGRKRRHHHPTVNQILLKRQRVKLVDPIEKVAARLRSAAQIPSEDSTTDNVPGDIIQRFNEVSLPTSMDEVLSASAAAPAASSAVSSAFDGDRGSLPRHSRKRPRDDDDDDRDDRHSPRGGSFADLQTLVHEISHQPHSAPAADMDTSDMFASDEHKSNWDLPRFGAPGRLAASSAAPPPPPPPPGDAQPASPARMSMMDMIDDDTLTAALQLAQEQQRKKRKRHHLDAEQPSAADADASADAPHVPPRATLSEILGRRGQEEEEEDEEERTGARASSYDDHDLFGSDDEGDGSDDNAGVGAGSTLKSLLASLHREDEEAEQKSALALRRGNSDEEEEEEESEEAQAAFERYALKQDARARKRRRRVAALLDDGAEEDGAEEERGEGGDGLSAHYSMESDVDIDAELAIEDEMNAENAGAGGGGAEAEEEEDDGFDF